MKSRHNKKRNTAFVFEALAREATMAIINGDEEKKQKVVSIVRKHFSGDSLLKKDLECYRSLYENQNIDKETGEKIVEAAKVSKRLIDPDGLFKQQTEIINDINTDLSPETQETGLSCLSCSLYLLKCLSCLSLSYIRT